MGKNISKDGVETPQGDEGGDVPFRKRTTEGQSWAEKYEVPAGPVRDEALVLSHMYESVGDVENIGIDPEPSKQVGAMVVKLAERRPDDEIRLMSPGDIEAERLVWRTCRAIAVENEVLSESDLKLFDAENAELLHD